MKEKDRSSHCRSNCVNVPKFVYVSIGLDSLRYVEKATGFGGSYREIIMKKFRIFYQTKLGGLCLWFYYSGHFLKKAYDFVSK